MSTKTVSFKADEELKKEFDEVASNLAMPVSAMFTVFMRKVVDTQGIPFDLRVEPLISREALDKKLTEVLKSRVEKAEKIDFSNKADVEKLVEGWDEY